LDIRAFENLRDTLAKAGDVPPQKGTRSSGVPYSSNKTAKMAHEIRAARNMDPTFRNSASGVAVDGPGQRGLANNIVHEMYLLYDVLGVDSERTILNDIHMISNAIYDIDLVVGQSVSYCTSGTNGSTVAYIRENTSSTRKALTHESHEEGVPNAWADQ
jgi:hypothetical protein